MHAYLLPNADKAQLLLLLNNFAQLSSPPNPPHTHLPYWLTKTLLIQQKLTENINTTVMPENKLKSIRYKNNAEYLLQ